MSRTAKPKPAAEHRSTIETLADLKPDPMNARRHGERNVAMLERSLEQYGAARSIVVDEEGQIIAGHGVVEAAANVGIEKVRPVEADGNEIIAVVRRGLTKKQKAELAIAAMVWALLGIPISSFGKVQKLLKTLEARSEIVVKGE
ncbi:MAG TPA: ParB N-terminal domain-containing protein [Terriglobia bacterium]|nr:ParB N-terminal domain-containing protein [Terriglobia bacterium]